MGDYSPVRVVHRDAFDGGTAQTPGSQRLAAVTPSLGIDTGLWGGIFIVEAGASTGIHHHGEQETIAYVIKGRCSVRFGARGEFSATAGPGDFIHVPGFVPHREVNDSATEPFEWVVVRSSATPIVVNLGEAYWD